MLACTALVGCTDDDVVNNNELDKPKAEKMEAYMTFSIASTTNSSRGVNSGVTTGDSDGTEESSGHTNEGTANENNVKKLMIVYYNTSDVTANGDGLVKTYDLSAANSGITYNEATKVYSPTNPYELTATGTYNVLVILNPTETLAGYSNTNSSEAKTVYEDILKGDIENATATSVIGENATETSVIGKNADEFMMTNKAPMSIKVESTNNSPETAAKPANDAVIEVERVASKITFRPRKYTNFTAVGALKDGNNVYGITYTPQKYTYTTGNYWVKNTDGTYTYLIDLYPACTTDGTDKNIYVYINENGSRTCYELDDENTEPHTGIVDGYDEPQSARIVKSYTYTGSVLYTGGTASNDGDSKTYYVKLNKYVLTNLNNEINYVRHTGDTPTADIATTNAFGTVSNTRYLLDPNTKAKSGEVTKVTEGVLEFADGYNGATWFGESALLSVTDKIENGTATLTDLPGSNNDNNQYGEDGEQGVVDGEKTGEPNNVGSLLSYCLENSVIKNNQNALLTTGIIFEAQIYDDEGKVVPLMYHIKNKNGKDQFYSNLAALVQGTGGENSPWASFTDEDYNSETLKNAETLKTLTGAGIDVYMDGKCYYFSSQIKHFDYGEEEPGVMEYAIMRNNIYSLEVSSVNSFGFSSLDLTDNLTSSDSEKEKVYMTMTAKILPWIVRFNDINF